MAKERISVHPKKGASGFAVKATETLSGNRTLTLKEVRTYNAFSFDPGGAGRNLVLPAEAYCAGVFLFIANTADNPEVLTIQNDAAGTVCTPAQAETAIVWCDGTNWYGNVGANS